MPQKNGPVIDMTSDGQFIEPPRPSLSTILLRLALFAAALALIGALFWTAILLLPFLLLAGLLSYLMLRGSFRSLFTVRRF